MKENIQKETGGLIAVLVLSLMLIGIGILLFFIPTLTFSIIIRLFASAMIAFGIAKVAIYWAREHYKNVLNYDFSIGIITATIGVFALIKADDLNLSAVPFMGAMVLATAMIMFQYALQLRVMNGALFPFALILSIAVYLVSLLAFLDPLDVFSAHPGIFFIICAICGALGLLSLCLTAFRSHRFAKEEALRPAPGAIVDTDGAIETSASGPSTMIEEHDDLQEEVSGAIEEHTPEALEVTGDDNR